MEKREEYYLEFDQARQYDRSITEFLLEYCDTVRYTVTNFSHSCSCVTFLFVPIPIFNKDIYRDKRFQNTLDQFSISLLREKRDNTKYNNIQQGNRKFHHYFYKTNNATLKYIKQYGILENPYGFEDPTFYKNNQMIASVISHEPIIILFLTDQERQALNRKNVIFENSCPYCDMQ